MNYNQLFLLAQQQQKDYSDLLQNVPYERKGILYSEIFFLWICTRSHPPKRILESGRARGQSTLLLAYLFPDAEIISIEHDQNSPDVPVAHERLKNFSNVKLLFGDSQVLLPRLAKEMADTVVLIDGPKGFRGLRLAFRLLDNNNVNLIFFHDSTKGTKEREFLENYLPNILYSDDPSIAAYTHELDSIGGEQMVESLRFKPGQYYGFSLACMSKPASYNKAKIILASYWDQLVSRLKNKLS